MYSFHEEICTNGIGRSMDGGEGGAQISILKKKEVQ